MNDSDVIRAAVEGDKDAFAVLVDRYYQRCLRFAVRMLGNREDGEEAVQDAFIRAYRTLHRYEHRGRFEAWLFKILVNRCRTMAAARSRRRWDEPLEEQGPATESGADDPLLREDIRRALARLSAEQREAFILKYVEEMTYEEMADLTGADVSALKMRVLRAREQLQRLLTREDDIE
jgi:RNA polymerase sigma-70 factor (ECF subfamily)